MENEKENVDIKVNKKPVILIVDDSSMNRLVLRNILGDDYYFLEADNGEKGLDVLKKNAVNLIILDIVMPKMDGIKFLSFKKAMNNSTPVIVISAVTQASTMERAYDLGAIDYITRPISTRVVLKKVEHALLMTAKEQGLVDILYTQMMEKEKNVQSLILILSSIIEARNMESPRHVMNINLIAESLLHKLIQKTDKYHITEKDIEEIKVASCLHDIGKIAIPDYILSKPGGLTKEEFEIMKTHSKEGYEMLKKNEYLGDNSLLERAKEIAHYHHEKWDGKGYPDGLVGDDIPISAQVVSIADCYDALTTKRSYKDAFTHEEALKMINDGKCGAFNPIVLECFNESADSIKRNLSIQELESDSMARVKESLDSLLKRTNL